MASKNAPTIIVNSKTLRVSVNTQDKTFFISPGLVGVGGKNFLFKGKEGKLLPSPCIIGIKAKGNYEKEYEVPWVRHGGEITNQAFYNIYLKETLQDFVESNGPTIGESFFKGFSMEDLPNLDPETIEDLGLVDSEACKNTKKELVSNYGKEQPSSYKTVRFFPEVEEIVAESLSLESSFSDFKNFKILATFVDEKLYQHQYGPVNFEPIYLSPFGNEFTSCIEDRFASLYAFKEIFKSIVVI
jgi:hypothetical protein